MVLEMLDRLADSFDAQRRFVANASHELRGPLTVIRSEAEVALANPEPDPDELRGMADAAVDAFRRPMSRPVNRVGLSPGRHTPVEMRRRLRRFELT